MRASTFAAALLAATTLSAPSAQAQFSIWLDGGYRTDRFENGYQATGAYAGGGFAAVITGTVRESYALLIPVTAEMRVGENGWTDMAANADLMARFGAVALGAGLDFRWPSAPDVPDDASSDGTVLVQDVQMFGYSASGRLNFGPQGRAFVQGRASVFPKDYGFDLVDECNSEYLDEDLEATCRSVSGQGVPVYEGAAEARVGIGYVFPGSGSARTLRLQWTHQRFDYSLSGDNLNGAYNRDADYFTLGFIFTM